MRLALILVTVGICGLGYTLYSSVFAGKYAEARESQRVEDSLNQLVEHIDAYTQYYERRTWECHTAIKMTEQCMALPEGEQRALLREQMKSYVREFNAYLDTMKPFCKQELNKA